jgi:hypothetical protein
MPISRRNFIAASSALLALTACGEPFQKSFNGRDRKKGLAGAAPIATNLITSWYYNWGPRPSTGGMPSTTPSMRFFPMVWGWYPKSTPALLQTLKSEHLPVVLGFNEPDNKSQSNIPVQTAIAAWPQFQGVARELVSPAPANPLGSWMQTFMNAVEQQDLQVDAVAVHSYGGINATAFLNMLNKVHDLYQRPIYVTEFAVADWQAVNGKPNRYTVEQVAEFMGTVCPAMDKLSWVKGYAWFPWPSKNSNALATSVLFNSDGTLNDLGKLYGVLSPAAATALEHRFA